MDTSNLKPFATNMRTLLMNGVEQRMRYWGFADGPEPSETVEEVEGGYVFRGEVHSGAGVPGKWRALKKAVKDHSVKDVIEAAASTWFNRLMAIRILEKNGHDRTLLGYAPDTEQPQILYNAAQGILPYGTEAQKNAIRKALQEGDDDAALRTLLTAYANDHDLLKDVFGRVEDYTELLLPARLTNDGGIIDTLVTTDAITDEDYEQVELIGWLYQFYISEKKDEVYDQKGKFRPEDIPAATQIFTPNWIVKYMVENTVGKLWLEGHPDSPLRQQMEYLVENEEEGDGNVERGGEGEQEQGEMFEDAAGEKAGDDEPLISEPRELQLFDPAAGSGHILVEGFDLLVKIYTEAGYTTREAVEFILTENLLGLDIDRRAAELARFALLMKAARHDKRVLQRRDLRPQVYAMPEPRSFSNADLRAYLGDDAMDQHGEAIREALEQIRKHGQNVGSALKLDLSGAARAVLAERVDHWGAKVAEGAAQLDEQALHQELRGYLKPLLLLTDQYPAVAMNPPYLGSGNMNRELKEYVYSNYGAAKRDMATVFMSAALRFSQVRSRCGMINIPSWMFLTSYQELRELLIGDNSFASLLHLGRGIFGSDFGSVAFVWRVGSFGDKGVYYRLFDEHVKVEEPSVKRKRLDESGRRYEVRTSRFLDIPGCPIAYWAPDQVVDYFKEAKKLRDKAELKQGLKTGDNKRFLKVWSEVSRCKLDLSIEQREHALESDKKWFPCVKGGEFRKWYGNNTFVVNWENSGEEIRNFTDDNGKLRSRPQNTEYYFREGITWTKVSSSSTSFRYVPPGCVFESNGSMCFPEKIDSYDLIAFLNSDVVVYLLQILSPTIDFGEGALGRLPVAESSQEFDRSSRSCISIAKTDWDSRETSWDFTQHPLAEQTSSSIEDAYAAWKQQATGDFFQLHANEEELNAIFIDLYGLKDELSPRVSFGDITILEDEIDEDALDALDERRDAMSDVEVREALKETFKIEVPVHQFLSYGIGVMLGRYRLGKDGLHIAHPEPSKDELAPYTVQTPDGDATFEIDDDAILPLMGSDSPFSDDAVYRMRQKRRRRPADRDRPRRRRPGELPEVWQGGSRAVAIVPQSIRKERPQTLLEVKNNHELVGR